MENLISQFTESLIQQLYMMGNKYIVFEQDNINICLEEVFKEQSHVLMKK